MANHVANGPKTAGLDEKTESIKAADIVVGIPSYNAGESIVHVIEMVKQGLVEHFPSYKSVLVVSDGGSSDNTLAVAKKAAQCEELETVCFCYRGIPGKGSAVKAIFETAQELGAKACVMVDADLKSISPEWMKFLISPVLDSGHDMVTPYYLRHKYDGTITRSIVYPLTRALYGKNIHQPIGGDFAFSGKFAAFCLGQDVWESDVARFGIDIWLTTTAIANGFNICEASLGLKIHDAKDPGSSLGSMFKQVVGTMFALMGKYEDFWMKESESFQEDVKVFGEKDGSQEPEEIKITISKLNENFQSGAKENYRLWQRFLPEERLKEIMRIADGEHSFSKKAWVETVYDFAVAYQTAGDKSQLLVESMVPLYFGYVAAYAKETEKLSTLEADLVIDELHKEFLKEKDYLAESWGRSRRKIFVA